MTIHVDMSLMRNFPAPVTEQEFLGNAQPAAAEQDELTPFFQQCYEAEDHTRLALAHLSNGEPEKAEPELRLAQARITTAKKITEREAAEVAAISQALYRMASKGSGSVPSGQVYDDTAREFHRAGFRVLDVDA